MLKLKTTSRDGTTQLVMSPMEFMQRLAQLSDVRFNALNLANQTLAVDGIRMQIWPD